MVADEKKLIFHDLDRMIRLLRSTTKCRIPSLTSIRKLSFNVEHHIPTASEATKMKVAIKKEMKVMINATSKSEPAPMVFSGVTVKVRHGIYPLECKTSRTVWMVTHDAYAPWVSKTPAMVHNHLIGVYTSLSLACRAAPHLSKCF